MATKLIDVDSIAATLGSIPFFAEGPDEYVVVSAEQVEALTGYIQQEYPDTAAEKLEPIVNLESLLDAATDGIDESVELDLTDLLGFKREGGAIKRVTPPRLVATKDGGAALACGSVVVPVVQEGNTYRLGRLVATGDSGFEKGERQTQNGTIYFPSHRFVDESDKTIFRIPLYVKSDIESMDALGLALMSGEPLAEVLAQLGQGGGAKRMKDFITAETSLPFEAPIVAVARFESKSIYSKDGFSYAFTINAPEGRVSLWAQGSSEQFLMANFTAAEKKASSGTLKFRVTDRKDPNGDNSKVSVIHSILDANATSFFAQFTKGRSVISPGPAVAEIAAAKTAAAVVEEPKAEPVAAPVVEAPAAAAEPAAAEPVAAEPARATRASAFKRAKAAASA